MPTQTIRPSIARLEQSLYAYLTSASNDLTQAISTAVTIAPTHPSKPSDLVNGKGLVVISAMNDARTGRVITRWLASPDVQFVAYASDYARSRQLQELVGEAIDFMDATDLQMEGQRIQTHHRCAPHPVTMWSDRVGLFFTVMAYRFHLSKY